MSFPRYPAYKASGVEWLGEVPEHWEGLRLRFAAMLNPSKQEARSYAVDDLVSFLPMEAIGEDGRLSFEQEKEVGECLNGYTYFKEGDVCIAKITPCFENGKGAILRGLKRGIGFGTTELIVARPRVELLTVEFLDYLFRSNHFRTLGEAAMYGAGGQKRVPDAFVRDFSAFLPSLTEQLLIASFLDRETAKIDALIAEQQRLIELLQEKRQAVISHAVTKGLNPNAPMKDSGVEWLGEMPEHWGVAAVGHRYSVQLGKMLDTNQQTGSHSKPYLRVADVQWGGINTEELPEMDFPPEAEARYRLQAGDLLVNEGGSYVGRSAIWSAPLEECYYQKALHRLRAYDATKDSPYFMYYLMEHATRLGVFIAGGNQTTIDHLTAEQLRRYRFGFPPMQEQEEIASHLRLKTESLQQLTIQAESMVGVLKERRSALISAAVTGQIDVRGLVPEALE